MHAALERVVGCGIDIEDRDRFSALTGILGVDIRDRLLADVFTPREISMNIAARPGVCFPLGFCCKEACAKALGSGFFNGELSWTDIELLFHNPLVLTEYAIEIRGQTQHLARALGVTRIDASFSVKEDHVVFEIILVSRDGDDVR